MSIWGKIGGAAAGFLAGGPVGAVVGAIAGHVIDRNARLQITLVNDRVEHMFGYGRADLVGHTVEVLLPEAFRQVHVAHRQRFLDQPRTRPAMEATT